MLRIIVFNCIVLLWQLIFLNSKVHGDVLRCMIKDGEKKIHLNWIETEQLLANENLPVWIATHMEREDPQQNHLVLNHELQRNFINENLGSFTFYHDIKKSSAVVYYHNTQLIDGIVDTRYIIRKMPVSECNSGQSVGGNYVKKFSDNDTFHNYEEVIDLSKPDETGSPRCSLPREYEPPKKMRRIDHDSNGVKMTILHPEILIFIPFDIVNIIKNVFPNQYKTDIVAYYLSYFNSIDMLFAKLPTDNIKIHVNIAGIIIEDRNEPASAEESQACYLRYIEPGYIDTEQAIELISNYIDANRNVFTLDSFDFVFMPSRNKLVSRFIEGQDILGKSGYLDVYNERYTKRNHWRSLVSIVQHECVNEFVVTTHEISHLMNLTHDPCSEGSYFDGRQCYAIMQTQGRYCPNCLKWSVESLANLENYTRNKKNHCFLLNFPRSLKRHGIPFGTLSPSAQCLCYGYKPLNPECSDMIFEDDCTEVLVCDDNGEEVETILPLDGTPCGKNKVCWNRECVEYPE